MTTPERATQEPRSMSDDGKPGGSNDQPVPSAGWMSLTRIAVRAVSSFLTPALPPVPIETNAAALPRIISPDTHRAERIPKGQVQTTRWPVLHAGSTPKVDLAK